MRRRLARRTCFPLSILLLCALAAPAGGLAQGRPAEPAPVPTEPPKAEAPPGVEPSNLSLQDCLHQTLENNLDIAVRRYDPLKSEAAVTLNEAALDPLLTAGSSKDKVLSKSINSFIGLTDVTQRSNAYTLGYLDPLVTGGNYRIDLAANDSQTTILDANGVQRFAGAGFTTSWQLTLTQPLLRNRGPVASRWLIVTARNNLGMSEAQFRQVVIDTLDAAEKGYWDLDFALMNLRTTRSALKLAQDFLDQNRIKVRVGTLAPIEITQAEAGVADREEAVIEAENAVRTAEDALRRIMNVPRDSPLWSRPIQPTDAPSVAEATPDMNDAVSVAQQRRPDLEQARLDVKNRETELAYRRNQKRWALDFNGDYGVQGFDVDGYSGSYDDLGHRNQRNWRLALNLSIPIANRQAAANYSTAEYALTQSRFSLQNLQQTALVDVRNAVRAVETNLKRVKAAQVNIRLQREKLAAEQKKFENGMSTSFQVLSFQNDVTSAESRENQAIVDYNKSLVDLERAKGTLLEARQVTVPGTTGETPSAGPSAALHALWRRGLDPDAVTLLLPPAEPGAIVLPADFAFTGRPARSIGGR
jgi:outer membrane protein TolC